jgi:hypothetical protein
MCGPSKGSTRRTLWSRWRASSTCPPPYPLPGSLCCGRRSRGRTDPCCIRHDRRCRRLQVASDWVVWLDPELVVHEAPEQCPCRRYDRCLEFAHLNGTARTFQA